MSDSTLSLYMASATAVVHQTWDIAYCSSVQVFYILGRETEKERGGGGGGGEGGRDLVSKHHDSVVRLSPQNPPDTLQGRGIT